MLNMNGAARLRDGTDPASLSMFAGRGAGKAALKTKARTISNGGAGGMGFSNPGNIVGDDDEDDDGRMRAGGSAGLSKARLMRGLEYRRKETFP